METEATSPQSILRSQLFGSTINPQDFLRKVLELDQQSGQHEHAKENEKLLIEEKISPILIAADYEAYYQLLSITYCHLAQEASLFENDQVTAKEYFRKALDACLKRTQTKGISEWTNYIAATYAYFTEDVIEVEKALLQMKQVHAKITVTNRKKHLIIPVKQKMQG